MEKSARRRLESISRHLLLTENLVHNLHPNPSSSKEPNSLVSFSPVIIGGMVLDVHAKPSIDPVPGTTIPGTVRYVSGGVARNVAECMSKLDSKPFIVSVVGHDITGDILLTYWESAGLSTQGIRKLQGITTPVVSNIFDCRGEVAAGVASVEAVERFLTPNWIRQFRYTISSAPLLMVDANLHPQSLEVACQIAAESGVPVWLEPVSIAKSTRITSVVNYITCTTPNEIELGAMANALSSEEGFCAVKQVATEGKEQSLESRFQKLKPAITLLLDKGIKLLIVTLGSDGVLISFRGGSNFMKNSLKNNMVAGSGRQLYELVNKCCPSKHITSSLESGSRFAYSHVHFPSLPASVVRVTGAGDCLVGGILASICSGLDVMQSVAVGVAVAKAAVESEMNVPPQYSITTVAADAQKVFSAARFVMLD